MIILLVAIIFGLIFAYFATQNTQGVNIKLLGYEWSNIPIYLIAIGSLLLGIVISWILSIADALSSSFAIHGRDKALNEAKSIISELETKFHDLEIENARLQGEHQAKPAIIKNSHLIEASEEKEVEYVQRPNFFQRLRYNFFRYS